MKFSLDSGSEVHVIRGYGTGFVQVDDRRLNQSFVLTPESLRADWPPTSIHDLLQAHCDVIIDLAPEIVILGTGDQQQFPDPRLFLTLHEQRVGVEVMSNPAACRTYNIIRNEGRRVVAAIMLATASFGRGKHSPQ